MKPKKQPGIISRFEAKEFSKKLSKARQFKRSNIPVPESSFRLTLHRLGINSIWSWLIGVLILGVIIYLLYFPYLFKLSRYEIVGGTPEETARVTELLDSFVKKRGFLGIPNSNLIVFPKSVFKDELFKNEHALRGAFVDREFPNTLYINLDFKKEKFIVSNGLASFMFYENGEFASRLSGDTNIFFDTKDSVFIKLWWQGQLNGEGNPEIPNEVFDKIKNSVKAFKNPEKNSLDFFLAGAPELSSIINNPDMVPKDPRAASLLEAIGPSDIVMFTKWEDSDPNLAQKAYKILFDMTSDITETLARAEVVLARRPLDQQKQLYYIDMRYPDRAFLCNNGAVCSLREAPKTEVDPETVEEESLLLVPPARQAQVRGASD